MKNQGIVRTKLMTLLSVLVFGGAVNTSSAFDSTSASDAIDSGIALLESQQDITEGSWGNAGNLDYIYTAAAIDALNTANQRSGAYYSGVAWLENHNANNTDLQARKVMALVTHGVARHFDIVQITKLLIMRFRTFMPILPHSDHNKNCVYHTGAVHFTNPGHKNSRFIHHIRQFWQSARCCWFYEHKKGALGPVSILLAYSEFLRSYSPCQ